jgi:signal transduction histidine kinase
VATGRPELRRAIVWFLALNTLAIAVVGGAVFAWSIYLAGQQSVHFAEQSARGLGKYVIAPLCTARLHAGDPAAIADMDRVLRGRMQDGSVMRVKVWTPAGKIIYSDQRDLIGRSFELPADDSALIGTDRVNAEISTLTRRENQFENLEGRLVEVYMGIKDVAGQPLLFEAYFPVDRLDANARYIAWRLAPTALLTIVALQLLQLPLALALARRLDHAHRQHGRLLEHAIAASDLERRRCAQDLHDGVIQDLAGVGYTLGWVEQHLDAASEPVRERLQRVAGIVQNDLRALRQAMLEIHPPDLTKMSLEAAVNDLTGPLRASGATCQITVPSVRQLATTTVQLLYRAAREVLRNVDKHAHATRVEVELALPQGWAILAIRDDGVGFDPANPGNAPDHVGLRLLREAVEEARGAMEIVSARGEGTTVRVVLPTTNHNAALRGY